MSEINKPLRIFVAMPGTDMGPNASYKNPESVKKNLLQPAVQKLEQKLGCRIDLVIEKDKRQAGVIHHSMFHEAYSADVYIADLTGANPNVYLELGVRWAMRDYVTIPIVQNVVDLKFNVFPNRSIIYHPDTIISDIDDIVEAIQNGLKEKNCDSPVRQNMDVVIISRSDLTRFEIEIERLKKARGEDLLHAAEATEDPKNRISLLIQAANANPASVEALLELGKTYRGVSEYDKAESVFKNAQHLAPNNSLVHRELGVCYSKWGKPSLAANSLREAVRLTPNDAEAWSNLGGALRRLGMEGAPVSYNRSALEEARSSYKKAHDLDDYDLYASLNVSRLDLLLSKWEPERLRQAKEGFHKQLHLCRYKVQQDPKDYWRRFDLADALLFSEQSDEAQRTFSEAVEIIPKEMRKDVLQSVLGPLKNYLSSDVVAGSLRTQVEEAVKNLESFT